MRPKCAKAKGRRLQQFVRDAVIGALEHCGITSEDVRSTTMGMGGEDIQLSSAAAKLWPYVVECKNVEKINIWAALRQNAHHHHRPQQRPGTEPLLVFSRNRRQPMACVRANHWDTRLRAEPFGPSEAMLQAHNRLNLWRLVDESVTTSNGMFCLHKDGVGDAYVVLPFDRFIHLSTAHLRKDGGPCRGETVPIAGPNVGACGLE